MRNTLSPSLRGLAFFIAFALCHGVRAEVAKTTFMSSSNHTWLHQAAEMTNLPETLTLGTTGDFDGDGLEDILVGDFTDLYIAWNSTEGLEPFQKLSRTSGTVNRALWDEALGILWLQTSSPDRIEALTWSQRQLSVETTFDGAPRTLTLSPGLGVVSLRRQGQELELLTPDGKGETLIQQAPHLLCGYLWQGKGDNRLLLVQDELEGHVGAIRFNGETWQEPEWWEDTALTQDWHMQVTQDADGRPAIQVMGTDHESAWFKSVTWPTGAVLHEWRPSIALGEVEVHWIPQASGQRMLLLSHSPMTHAINLFDVDVTSGEVLTWTAVEELANLPFVLNPDLNGDGHSEWMWPVARQNRFSVVTDWSNLTMRWAWRSLQEGATRTWQDFGRLAQGWHNGLDQVDNAEEVWMHQGLLHVRSEDSWFTLKPDDSPSPYADMAKIRTAELPYKHQLVIPFLELGDLGNVQLMPGLAEVTPGNWHHLAFTREEDNTTHVWFDGQRIFQGKSKDLNYYYNSLIVGGYLGSHWSNFGEVSVDRATVSGSVWTDEEVLGMSQRRGQLAPGRYTERWDFDDDFSSERRKRPMVAHSDPVLEPGVLGNCVTLDGKDDVLQTYFAVPQKGVSLGLFFRFNGRQPKRPHTIATLYGMFNTWFQVIHQPKNYLLQATTPEGIITSPTGCAVEPSTWPLGARPFVVDGTLLLLDSNHRLFQKGPLGWEPMDQQPPSLAGRCGVPWQHSEYIHVLGASGQAWKWAANEGWQERGAWMGELPSEMVASNDGLFFKSASDTTWFWVGSPQQSLLNLTAFQGAMQDLVSSPLGQTVKVGELAPQPWTPSSRPVGLPVPARTEQGSSPIPWVLGLGAMLAAALGWSRHRRAPETLNQGPREWTLPADLAPIVHAWPHAGAAPLDAVALDELLSQTPHESDETKRGRRARFIREMNAWGQSQVGQDVVLREKDPHDRRRAVYVLHPLLSNTDRPESGAKD